MAEEHWEELVRRYAVGRPICNCGEAYYNLSGKALDVKTGEYVYDHPICECGCSANQLTAKYEIAERVLKELEK